MLGNSLPSDFISQDNLRTLHAQIIKGDFEWWNNQDFIGNYLYVPKSINDSVWSSKTQVHYRSVDPNQDWEQQFEESGKLRVDGDYPGSDQGK